MCTRKGYAASVALLTSLTAALAIRPYKFFPAQGKKKGLKCHFRLV